MKLRVSISLNYVTIKYSSRFKEVNCIIIVTRPKVVSLEIKEFGGMVTQFSMLT